MSATTAIVLLFASLGLVALALGLLARRYSALVLGAGLAGLLGLSMSATWIARAGMQGNGPDPRVRQLESLAADQQRDIGRRDAEVGRLNVRVADLEKQAAKVDELSSVIKGLEAKLADEQRNSRSKDGAIASLRKQLEAPPPSGSEGPQSREIARLTKELEEARLAAAREKNEGASKAEDLSKKLEAATRENEKLKTERAGAASQQPAPDPRQPRTRLGFAPRSAGGVQPPPQQPSDPPPAPGSRPTVAAELQRRLADRWTTPYFKAEPLRATELVSGLRGSWYVVRLDANGRPLAFANRRFSSPEAADAIKASARALDQELIAPVKASAQQVQLFFRGTADQRRYAGRDEMPPAGHEVAYLPRRPDGSFDAARRMQRSGAVVRNGELPNLRADWVRRTIAPVLAERGFTDLDILENPPAPGRARTVELVMFVKW